MEKGGCVEVAYSNLRFNSTTKATLYAALGVRDYWVVDAQTLTTRVHREPSAGGYASVVEVQPRETLVPLLAAALAVRLGALDLA